MRGETARVRAKDCEWQGETENSGRQYAWWGETASAWERQGLAGSDWEMRGETASDGGEAVSGGERHILTEKD